MNNIRKTQNLFITILSLITLLVWIAVFTLPDDKLRLITCNVGEGDANLLIFRNTEVLIDGGPGTKVIDCLSRYMPFWDREIEAVVLTHPDRDHMEGLIEVFKRYKVDNYFENSVEVSKQDYKVLKDYVGGSGVRVVRVGNDTKMSIGKIHLDILNGIENNVGEKKVIKDSETNDYSLVLVIKYGRFEALLTGDAPSGILEELSLQGYIPKTINYIKISHHGSKTGLTQALLELIKPQLAIISVGKNNYGHPAPEVLDLLKKNNVRIYRTDLDGDIEVMTDGKDIFLN